MIEKEWNNSLLYFMCIHWWSAAYWLFTIGHIYLFHFLQNNLQTPHFILKSTKIEYNISLLRL